MMKRLNLPRRRCGGLHCPAVAHAGFLPTKPRKARSRRAAGAASLWIGFPVQGVLPAERVQLGLAAIVQRDATDCRYADGIYRGFLLGYL